MRYILTLFTFLVLTQTVSAQGFSEVAIQLEPEYPQPGSSTSVSLKSYSQTLQGLKIGWYLDNILLQEGIGLTEIKLTVPLLGEQIKLVIKINDTIATSRVISPTMVDILWEAQTYTPKHYLGRALPADSSKIRAVAIPHLGRDLDNAELIYNWYRGSTFLSPLSGRGKDSITINSPGLYDDYNLSVEVTDSKGLILGQNGVHINTIEPELVFYNISPLLGMGLHKALSQDLKRGIEDTFTAIPYYFSITNPKELAYTWRISNAESLQEASPNSITITSARAGATIALTAQHENILLQSSSSTYRFPLGSDSFNTRTDKGSYQSPFGSPDN